jgi:hypothetical protein
VVTIERYCARCIALLCLLLERDNMCIATTIMHYYYSRVWLSMTDVFISEDGSLAVSVCQRGHRIRHMVLSEASVITIAGDRVVSGRKYDSDSASAENSSEVETRPTHFCSQRSEMKRWGGSTCINWLWQSPAECDSAICSLISSNVDLQTYCYFWSAAKDIRTVV